MNVLRQAVSVPMATVRTSWVDMNVFVIEATNLHH